jgi:hypothetical protein
VKETAIEKRGRLLLRERGQYALGFSVIALMLYFAGFPVFLLFFVGILTFFIWKVFSTESRSETRRIFEFYLAANEILREDDRRWYGFEIQETIARGETILRSMSTAPPLVHFTLGALYQKLDDHASEVKHLSKVIEEPPLVETNIVFPTRELREYVRTLRKIERFPAEAPITSSAVRALERARKNRGRSLLENSRSQLEIQQAALPEAERQQESIVDTHEQDGSTVPVADHDQPSNVTEFAPKSAFLFTNLTKRKRSRERETKDEQADRKTISEVLHDIYDKNGQ